MLVNRKLALTILVTGLLCSGFSYAQTNLQDSAIVVPLGGNAWRTDKDTLGGKITNDGIMDWSNPGADYTAYIRFSHTGNLTIYLNMAVPEGTSKIAVTALGTTITINTSGKSFKNTYVGDWMIRDT